MSNSTSQNQETKQLPLDSPLIKLAFLPQNHPKYLWKRLGTKGRLPTFKVERLDREFPIRKVPISVNMSGISKLQRLLELIEINQSPQSFKCVGLIAISQITSISIQCLMCLR